MFGYIKPLKPMMLIKEYEIYKGVYCSLCRYLKKNYGFQYTALLSYDTTFLTMILNGTNGTGFSLSKGRCQANCLKKCVFAENIDSALDFSAAFTVISAYYKIYDNITDGNFFAGLFYRFLKIFFKRGYKKAAKKYPEIDSILKTTVENQALAEKNNCDIDSLANPSAKMLKNTMLIFAKNENEKTVYGEFGYHLGRWIYFIDAADDIKKDFKSKSFNAFTNYFKLTSDELSEEQKIEINQILNFSASRITSAYDLMEIKTFKPITDNIIYKGLGEMQRKVIFENNFKQKEEKI